MTTAVLQLVIAVLKLCFGLAGLRIAGLTREEGARSTAWLLVGIGMTLSGASGVVQGSWALRAFLAGPGSLVQTEYLQWAQPLNYGRHAIMLMLAALLLALPVLARARRGALGWGVGAVLLAGVAGGAWAGAPEGRPEWTEHYVATAVLDSLEMALLFVALLAALRLGTMDRVLWVALAVYATRQALSVVSFSGIAWIQVPGMWSPSPRHIAWTGFFLWALLLALAVHRLSLAARGKRSPALLEHLPRGTTPSLIP